jgi:hypothetical protein
MKNEQAAKNAKKRSRALPEERDELEFNGFPPV